MDSPFVFISILMLLLPFFPQMDKSKEGEIFLLLFLFCVFIIFFLICFKKLYFLHVQTVRQNHLNATMIIRM